MTKHKVLIGKAGEESAAEYLTGKGVHILERNYRSPHGEIDIIGKMNDEYIFIEVKTRTSTACGYPEESIGSRKRNALIDTVSHFLQKNKIGDVAWRIDVISILTENKRTEIEWIQNAITC